MHLPRNIKCIALTLTLVSTSTPIKVFVTLRGRSFSIKKSNSFVLIKVDMDINVARPMVWKLSFHVDSGVIFPHLWTTSWQQFCNWKQPAEKLRQIIHVTSIFPVCLLRKLQLPEAISAKKYWHTKESFPLNAHSLKNSRRLFWPNWFEHPKT